MRKPVILDESYADYFAERAERTGPVHAYTFEDLAACARALLEGDEYERVLEFLKMAYGRT